MYQHITVIQYLAPLPFAEQISQVVSQQQISWICNFAMIIGSESWMFALCCRGKIVMEEAQSFLLSSYLGTALPPQLMQRLYGKPSSIFLTLSSLCRAGGLYVCVYSLAGRGQGWTEINDSKNHPFLPFFLFQGLSTQKAFVLCDCSEDMGNHCPFQASKDCPKKECNLTKL